MLEVAEGIRYIHSEGIVHGDLHGVRILIHSQSDHLILFQENVLIDADLHCQISGFGLARPSEAAVTQSTTAFSLSFAAPELFGMCIKCGRPECTGCYEGHGEQHRGKTTETDVYAFGCLYYAVRFGFSFNYEQPMTY